MKKRKSIFSLILAISMIISLAACQQSVGQESTPVTTMAAETDSSNLIDPTEAMKSSYPIVTDGSVTLTYWCAMPGPAAKYIANISENISYQEKEKATGVKIDYIHPAIGQEREQFNLLMVSNDLPDIIGSAVYYTGGEFQGMNDSVFLDITDYLAELAPDYLQLIKNDPEFFREVSDNNGRIVGFDAYKPQGDPPFMRIILREDVLAEINIEIPQTLDEIENMFGKMLEIGITPYALNKTGYEEQYIGMYGIYAKSTNGMDEFYKDENDKIQFGQIQPTFKDYLMLMNDWYNKGYISKDFTTLDTNQTNTLFDTKKLGTFIGPIVANFNRGLTQNIAITSAPYPRINLDDRLHYESTDIWPRMPDPSCMAVISRDCNNIEAAIRWMNWNFTQEGADILNWGVEGVNYDMVNGKRVYNDLMLNNEQFGTEEASYIYKMHFAPKLTYLDTICHANLLKSPKSLESRFKWADDDKIDSMHKLPPFQLNADNLDRRTKIMTEISTYADEMVLKFIIGAESLDNFDQFTSTIKSMGIDEAIELTQSAYDQYMTKKLS